VRILPSLFLLLLALGRVEAQPASETSKLQLFYQEAGHEVDRSTHKREGIVLWLDRSNGDRTIFGDASLLQKKFLPGSTLKLVTAELAVGSGRSYFYHCSGRDTLGGKTRHCWIRKGHGDLDLAQALGQSCNLFFSWLGTQLGYERLRGQLVAEGFSSAQALPEQDNLISAAADLAIGDLPGFAVSPEELANFWNRYLDRLSQPDFTPIRQGLRRAAREGTAKKLAQLDLEILGKTGTGDALTHTYKTNGWFLGAYPVERPRWAIVIFLQEAHGFDEAAGLAERVFLLAQKMGLL